MGAVFAAVFDFTLPDFACLDGILQLFEDTFGHVGVANDIVGLTNQLV